MFIPEPFFVSLCCADVFVCMISTLSNISKIGVREKERGATSNIGVGVWQSRGKRLRVSPLLLLRYRLERLRRSAATPKPKTTVENIM
jgi:hypothetical protein